jgi:hypothetical protein
MWHFRRKRKGEKIRDPIQGEFFATDAIANPAQALIRESIQNSLDAAVGDVVTVRIYLSTRAAAVPWTQSAHFFDGAWPHFEAPRNGLRDAPQEGDDCDYLVVEDFGTSGLTGDVGQSDPTSDTKNPFFLFFRAEGRSDKGELERGRWGVGKFVFPRSSRISTHFGLTVREDDGRTMLLGAVTLKSHIVNKDTYCPDGLYGVLREEDFVLPIDETSAISDFRSTFSISRTTEPGLSVVVPYVDPEVTFQRLVAASATDYFLPILQGQLVVKLESPGQTIVLEAGTLERTLAHLANDEGKETARYTELARWSAQLPDHDRYVLDTAGSDGGVPRWSPDLVPSALLARIREDIREHRRIAVRVPLLVRPKTLNESKTYLDVLMVPDRHASGRPLFAREGIVVSDIKAPRAREIRSLILVEDKPLATFLGDSENPAHTQWQKDGSNFRGRYKYGPGTLDFVTTSVAELMKIVNSAEEDEDPSLTVDFFSLPGEEEDDTEKGTEKQRQKPEESRQIIDKIKRNPAKLEIQRHAGGFKVSGGPGAPSAPFSITIQTAYDVRTGNPLKRYHIADFDIAASEFDVQTSGVRIATRKRNTILATAERADFSIQVSGFDEARDLYVRADVASSERREDDADADTQG